MTDNALTDANQPATDDGGATVKPTVTPSVGPIDSSNDPGMTDSLSSDPVAVTIDAAISSQTATVEAVMIPGFDPAIHAVNPDGSPKLRANGAFALKRGRKARNDNSQSTNASRSSQAIDSPSQAQSAPANDVSSKQAAALAWSAFEGFASATIGPEWQAETHDERKAMISTITAYFDAKGGAPDIPPGIVLTIALFGYGVKRYRHPNTADKVKFVAGKAWGWVKRVILRRG